ncbi:hypothetical protein [Terribacillus sp. AE2B 122]|uniref:hypothetical protein n=1 Tax=Terribacillus sp. AE2B 122 TaxID=1331902 RepID=UPI0015831F08|nr:hypothetical protein [Terribacillus sp. AE2B 122]
MIPFELMKEAKKEYSIRSVDFSDYSVEALAAIGLSDDETDIGIVLSKLQECDDIIQQVHIGTVLFGTMYEDIADYIAPKETEFLSIKLSNINGVPEVWYKGERINPLYRLRLDWHTKTDEPLKDMTQLDITYISKEDGPNFRTIGYNL